MRPWSLGGGEALQAGEELGAPQGGQGADDGQPIRSRHGLTFAPRADLAAAAPGLDRLLVPGADAARRAVAHGLPLPERPPVVHLHQQPGFAGVPWTLTLRPILIAAAAVAAVLGVRFLGRRRGAFRGGDRAAPPAQPAATSSNVEPSAHLTRRRS